MRLLKRIHAPIDQLVMQPTDMEFVKARTTAINGCIVSWLLPVASLQQFCHPRYEIEAIAEHPEHGRLGLLTVCASMNRLLHPGWLDRILDGGEWQPSLSLRVNVMDRVHWQRTYWGIRSYCKSRRWGSIPRRVLGIDLNNNDAVEIDTEFVPAPAAPAAVSGQAPPNGAAATAPRVGRYARFNVAIPTLDLELQFADTGVDVLAPEAPPVLGFTDNESALRILAMARETNTYGEAGMVYRQPYFATPVMPSVANVRIVRDGFFLKELKTPLVLQEPIAAWLINEVEEIKLYREEASVEEENEPNTSTHFGDKTLHNRVQQKAMNRYFAFREEVRQKSYADIEGRETPR